MKDEELFDLCKEVYEATGWSGTDFNYYPGERSFSCVDTAKRENRYLFILAPLYTSDYLLEKLPPALWVEVTDEGKLVALLAVNMQGNGEAIAVYEIPYDKEFRGSYSKRAETPLKALLKLTIALHEAGELKDVS